MRVLPIPAGLLCVLLSFFVSVVPVQGQGNVSGWSTPVDLTKGLPGKWFRPSIAADDTGSLHVAWCGHTDPDPTKGSFATNSILYTRQEGSTWSDPIDIVWDENGAYNPRLYVDLYNVLHMYWEGSGKIIHSSASVEGATRARNWTAEPVANGTSFDVAAVGDTVHLVAVVDIGNVYYLRSQDGGATWSSPEFVASIGDRTEYGIDIISVATDAQHSVHIAWSVNSRSVGWNGESLWYVRSADDHHGWAQPQVLDRNSSQPGWVADPKVALDDGGIVHVLWHRGIGHTDGRFHVWSDDNGATWSSIRPSFPGYRGVTGPDSVVFDDAGRLHLFMAGAPPGDSAGRIHHSVWEDGQWSSLETIGMGEHPSAVLCCDGRLAVVWWLQSGIGFSERQNDVSAGRCASAAVVSSRATPPATVPTQALKSMPSIPADDASHAAQTQTKTLGAVFALGPLAVAALASGVLLAGAVLITRRR